MFCIDLPNYSQFSGFIVSFKNFAYLYPLCVFCFHGISYACITSAGWRGYDQLIGLIQIRPL